MTIEYDHTELMSQLEGMLPSDPSSDITKSLQLYEMMDMLDSLVYRIYRYNNGGKLAGKLVKEFERSTAGRSDEHI